MDALVRSYLVARGAKSTLSEFDKEFTKPTMAAAVTEGEGSLTHRYMLSRGGHGVPSSGSGGQNMLTQEELIVWGLQNGEPTSYKEGYLTFRTWVNGSLDLIKAELNALCFPIFVISYMSLIRQGFADAARDLWDVGAEDHKDFYPVEVQALSMMTSSEQLSNPAFLATYPFIQSVSQNKFKVRLSGMVANLLTTFLAQNNLLLVAAIVNEKIQIERHNQLLPADDTTRKPELRDYALDTVRITEPQPGLYLGVPGAPPARGTTQIPNYRDSELWSAWMKTLVIRKVFAKNAYAAASATVGGGGVEGQGGRVAFGQQRNDSTTTGGGLRDAHSPSVIFATFTNVNDGMICLHMDKDVTRAVGGFRDSCVRVWEIQEQEEASRENVHKDFTKIIPWKDAGAVGGVGSVGALGSSGYNSSNRSISSVTGRRPRDSGPNMIELRGHSKPVYSVTQSLDSRTVLSSSSDLTIRLWDVAKRHCMVKYNCRMPSWDVHFSPVDYYFASANMDRTLSVYSTDRLEPVRIMTGHSSDVTCCRWHGNACLVASGSDDKTARLWDFRTTTSVRTFSGSHAAISCIAFSPAGTVFAAGSDSGSIYLWDMATGTQMALLRGHTGAVHSISFCKNGNTLSSGGADCSIKIWDISGSISEMAERSTSQKGHHKTEAEPMGILQPIKSFYTKLSPVYFVDHSPSNLLFAGGPFSVDAVSL